MEVLYFSCFGKIKGKVPLQSLGAHGFQEVKVPRLRDNGPEWWKVCQPDAPVVFTPGNIPGTHFCKRLSRLQVHSAI